MPESVTFTQSELERIARDARLRRLLEQGNRKTVKDFLNPRAIAGAGSAGGAKPLRPSFSGGVYDSAAAAMRRGTDSANKRN